MVRFFYEQNQPMFIFNERGVAQVLKDQKEDEFKEKEYDKLAKLLRENLDIKEIYRILS